MSRLYACIGIFGLAVIAGAFVAGVFRNQPESVNDAPSGGLVIESDVYGSPIGPEAATLAGSPDYAVVRGTVVALSEAAWNTPDGLPPVGYGPKGLGTAGYSIYRTASVRVDRVLVGTSLPSNISVTTLGGQVGEVTMRFSAEVPRLENGAAVLVFLVRGSAINSFAPDTWTPLLSYDLRDGLAYHPVFGVIDENRLVSRVQQAAAVNQNR